MPASGLHTVSTPTPSKSWVNVRDPVLTGVCTALIKQSTAISQIDRGATRCAYRTNIRKRRTTLWLWLDPVHLQFMTVAFHSCDQPVHGPGRFYVCAGVDLTISDDDAFGLWKDAVRQFAVINGTTTDQIYLWADKTDGEPRSGDRIYPTFCKMITVAGSLTEETYTNVRWPTAVCTRKLNNPIP
jgi:hypothetical protein